MNAPPIIISGYEHNDGLLLAFNPYAIPAMRPMADLKEVFVRLPGDRSWYLFRPYEPGPYKGCHGCVFNIRVPDQIRTHLGQHCRATDYGGIACGDGIYVPAPVPGSV